MTASVWGGVPSECTFQRLRHSGSILVKNGTACLAPKFNHTNIGSSKNTFHWAKSEINWPLLRDVSTCNFCWYNWLKSAPNGDIYTRCTSMKYQLSSLKHVKFGRMMKNALFKVCSIACYTFFSSFGQLVNTTPVKNFPIYYEPFIVIFSHLRTNQSGTQQVRDSSMQTSGNLITQVWWVNLME